MNDFELMIHEGLLEKFIDGQGVERVRPTPKGARVVGDEKMANALEECRAGRHTPFGKAKCACGFMCREN